jgi:tRNA pseudouridine38-40 synthase
MPHFKVTIAYDGTDYVGWQRQANGVSIQGIVETALRDLDDRDVTVIGAGRTDAGVHALGQVAAFTLQRDLPAATVVRAVNARLPGAIRVLSAETVDAAFHPRFGATAKTYRYRIARGDVLSPFERRYAWHVAGSLDVEAMGAAATLVEGKHDFGAFQAAGSDVATTVREIFVSRIADCGFPIRHGESGATASGPPLRSVNRPPAMLVFEISGSGFLRHMVRTIVGTLVEIGRGRHPVEWMSEVLALRERTMAGPTAPAAGLFLVGVEYGPADDRHC